MNSLNFQRTITQFLLLSTAIVSLTRCGWLGDVSVKGDGSTSSVQSGELQPTPGPNNTLGSGNGSGTKQLVLYVPQPVGAGMCWPGTVTALVNGVAVALNAPLSANLSGQSGAAFYQSPTCSGGSVSSVTVPSGASSTPVWLRLPAAGNFSLSVSGPSDSGYQPSTVTVVVTDGGLSNAPVRIALEGPGMVTSNTCQAYTATFVNSNGTPTAFAAASQLLVSASGVGGTFHQAPDCTGASSNQFEMAAGAFSRTVYFRGVTSGLAILGAVANGLSGNLNVLVVPGSASALAVAGPLTIPTNYCAGYTLALKDSAGNLTTSPSALSADLSQTGSGEFFSDAACTQSLANVTFPVGGSVNAIFYRTFVGGAVTLQATAVSVSPGVLGITVNQMPGTGPVALAIEAPGSATYAGNCFGPYVIRAKDAMGNVLPGAPVTAVLLAQNGSGKFFADNNCSQESVSSQVNGNFYFRDFKAETVNLQANDPTSTLVSASQSVLVTAGLRHQLSVYRAGPGFPVGSCELFHVAYTDSFGNGTAVTQATTVYVKELFLGASGKFFSDSSCATALVAVGNGEQSLPFAAQTYSQTMYFKTTKAGDGLVRANDNQVNPGAFYFTATGGEANQAVLVRSPGSVLAGQCQGPFELELRDSFGNGAAATSNLMLSLTASQGATYSDSACASASNQVAIAQGNGSGMFYLNAPNVGAVTLNWSGGGLSSGQAVVPVLSGTQSQRVAVVAKQSGAPLRGPVTTLAGACSAIAVRVEDGNGNPMPAMVARNALLGILGDDGAAFFSDSSCTIQIQRVTIPATASESALFVRSNKSGVFELVGTVPDYTSVSLALNVSPGPATSLQLSGPTLVTAGQCSGPYTVSGRDAHGNIAGIASGSALVFTGTSSGSFHLTSNCSDTAVGGANVLAPAIAANFYFRDTRAVASAELKAQHAGLGSASLGIRVRAGEPHHLVLLGTPNVARKKCGTTLRLAVEDAWNNRVVSSVNREFLLSQTGSVGIYSENCASPVASVTIAANATTSSGFSLKSDLAQEAMLKVRAVSDAPCLEQQFVVNITCEMRTGTFTYDDPWKVRGVQQACALRYGKRPVPNSGAVHNDAASAQEVCRCAGYARVASRACAWTGDRNRCGYDSPHNNHMGSWVVSQGNWAIESAAGRNEWLGQLTCADPITACVDEFPTPTPTPPPPPPTWYEARAVNCSSFCATKGKTLGTDAKGNTCVSGEARPASATNKVTYPWGCWRDCSEQPLTNNTFSVGGYCYAPGQKKDNDRTDITVACFCK